MVIPVNLGEKSYEIHLEKGGLDNIGQLFDLNRRVLVVTDDGVPEKYAKYVCDVSKNAFLVVIPAGEASKNLDTSNVVITLPLLSS